MTTNIPEGEYIISLRILSSNPSVSGGLKFDQVMLRPVGTSPVFVPYMRSNLELTHDTDGVRGVGRNLLNISTKNSSQNGLTITVDKAAGTVTVNGTATANTFIQLVKDYPIKAGKYIFSKGKGTAITDIYVNFRANSQSTQYIGGDVISKEVSVNEDGIVNSDLAIMDGVTVDNVTFKPMIRSAKYADDSTFYPYSQNEIEFQHFMYDEGTFVAAYSFHGGNTDTTTGHFHKVGKMVFIQVPFTTTSAVTINGNDLLFSLSSLPSAYPFRTDYGLYLPNLALYNLTPILSYDRVRVYAMETFELPANTKMLFSLAYVTS